MVGSGTLITFPVLLGFGYAPVVANVSNTIGLVPGSVAGAIGYRRELRGQRRRLTPLAPASALRRRSAARSLLLTLPASAFKAIVPVFIAIALRADRLPAAAVGAAGRTAAARADARARPAGDALGVFASGIYGGYFGAAQGIMLLAILGLALGDELQRLNALKNVLAGLVNLSPASSSSSPPHVAWAPVALIAVGSTIGGALGARYGRRLPPSALRALIVVVGIVAIVRLVG